MRPREGTEICTRIFQQDHLSPIGKYETPRGDGNAAKLFFSRSSLFIGKYETPRGDGNESYSLHCSDN